MINVAKSGMLIEFLKNWDSDCDTVPDRMEQLWIDLYEHGYIEENDVYSVQLWLGALHQAGYKFPPLKKRRYRNVAVMGQFNYADNDSIIEQVIFWTQKNLERFQHVLVAGPFNDDQMSVLNAHSIDVIQGRDDKGFVSPYESHIKALLRYQDDDRVEGVIHVHDDAIMNLTDLTEGKVSDTTI